MADDRTNLSVGEWSLALEGPSLRWIRWRGVEVLRGLEVTVRDAEWGTVQPRVLAQIESRRGSGSDGQRESGAEIRLDLEYNSGPLDLAAEVTVDLDAAGVLALRLRATARTTFERNRIGIICLHPMEVAGRRAAFRHQAGIEPAGFPKAIDPDVVSTDLVGVEWRPVPGVRAQLSLTGERWEMEDQRNWTDASFKTYPTPLRLPYPVKVEAGTVIEQTAIVEVRGAPARPHRTSDEEEIQVGSVGRQSMPRILSELPFDRFSEPVPLDAIRALGLGGFRVLLDTASDDAPARVSAVARTSNALGVPVAVDALIGDANRARGVLGILFAEADVDDVFAFDRMMRRALDSSERAVSVTREAAASSASGRRIRVGGGTRANFTELNRLRPNANPFDLVTYSVTPQIHAFDEASIIETLPVLAMTVRDSRRLIPRPISVVLSLRPRFNAVARGAPDDPLLPDQSRADPRQDGPFAAAWLLGAISQLSVRGVDSITVAETHGPAGLVETGGQRPTRTPAGALVASIASSAGRAVGIRAPAWMAGLALDDDSKRTIWLANLTDRVRTARFVPDDCSYRCEALRAHPPADNEQAWVRRAPVLPSHQLRLRPWEVVLLTGSR